MVHRLFAVSRLKNLMPRMAKHGGQHFPEWNIVLNQEDQECRGEE